MSDKPEPIEVLEIDARFTPVVSEITWVDHERAIALGMVGEFQTYITGPRLTGGEYRNGYWGQRYTVTSIQCGYRYVTRKYWGRDSPVTELESAGTVLTCTWETGEVTQHMTAWDSSRDEIVQQPTLPQRKVRLRVGRYVHVPAPAEHQCSLCQPGVIGIMERQYRLAFLDRETVLRDADLIAMHHKNVHTTESVSLAKG